MSKKTNFDKFLEAQYKIPNFKKGVEKEIERLEIALEIAKIRIKSELSQADLAKKVHTSRSAISRIENGNQNISVGLLKRIAEALNKKLVIRLL